MTAIAIITDFGVKDGNVGVMKGVIAGICPAAQIIDVSHMIGPQNLREAALILARSAAYFPPGTIHLVVVDPGVGTARRPMGARVGSSYYVGPDNGAITLWLERANAEGLRTEFARLDRPAYWRKDVSHVFHGRDIFSPVAAYLASGVSLRSLGSPIADPVLLDFPRPRRAQDGLEGEVIHIDHFGNVASNIWDHDLGESRHFAADVQIQVGSARITGLVQTFGERPPGELVALFGSTGNLIVSVVNGDAASTLGVHVGDPFRIIFAGSQPNREAGA